jgi:hypothetical protein
MGMGGTHGRKGRFPLINLVFGESFVGTNEGSLGNEKMIFKGLCFFDKGDVDGWGATWEKNKLC